MTIEDVLGKKPDEPQSQPGASAPQGPHQKPPGLQHRPTHNTPRPQIPGLRPRMPGPQHRFPGQPTRMQGPRFPPGAQRQQGPRPVAGRFPMVKTRQLQTLTPGHGGQSDTLEVSNQDVEPVNTQRVQVRAVGGRAGGNTRGRDRGRGQQGPTNVIREVSLMDEKTGPAVNPNSRRVVQNPKQDRTVVSMLSHSLNSCVMVNEQGCHRTIHTCANVLFRGLCKLYTLTCVAVCHCAYSLWYLQLFPDGLLTCSIFSFR